MSAKVHHKEPPWGVDSLYAICYNINLELLKNVIYCRTFLGVPPTNKQIAAFLLLLKEYIFWPQTNCLRIKC